MSSDTAVKIVIGAPYVFSEIPKRTVVFEFFTSDGQTSLGFFVKVGKSDVMRVDIRGKDDENGEEWCESKDFRHSISPSRFLTVRAVGVELLPQDGRARKKLPPFHKVAISFLPGKRDFRIEGEQLLGPGAMQLAAITFLSLCDIPEGDARTEVIAALKETGRNCAGRKPGHYLTIKRVLEELEVEGQEVVVQT